MADLSIGVIGAGGMGSRHAVNLQFYVKGARVTAIYDLDQVRAEQVVAECGAARAFQDPLQLIQDAGVEAVVIASPVCNPYRAAYWYQCQRQRDRASIRNGSCKEERLSTEKCVTIGMIGAGCRANTMHMPM